MKYIKTFESYSVNEEFLGILAVAALALGGGAIYTAAKRAWSKHVTGSKYEATGKTELVKNESTGKEFKIDEYEDSDGNLYCGYDHLYDPDYSPNSDAVFSVRDMDLYRAIYKIEDKSRLARFLKGLEASVTENPKSMNAQVAVIKKQETYVDIPAPVDIIFIDDYDEERLRHGNF
jgi:hypothetical protein